MTKVVITKIQQFHYVPRLLTMWGLACKIRVLYQKQPRAAKKGAKEQKESFEAIESQKLYRKEQV